MPGRVNTSPITAREGYVYLDGVLIADSCKFKVTFKPDVWKGKQLSEKGTNRRWIGYDVEILVEEWKTTNRYNEMVMEYVNSGKTPEVTIQGIRDDKESDYYDNNGGEKITCIGCVPDGDVVLLDMDTEGEVVKESITFGAKRVA